MTARAIRTVEDVEVLNKLLYVDKEAFVLDALREGMIEVEPGASLKFLDTINYTRDTTGGIHRYHMVGTGTLVAFSFEGRHFIEPSGRGIGPLRGIGEQKR